MKFSTKTDPPARRMDPASLPRLAAGLARRIFPGRRTHTESVNHPSHRKGTILIFVVALLVLLALIGTAYIATTRSDRYATQQHAANTQVEFYVDSVINLVKSAAIEDLQDTAGNWRGTDGGYLHRDGETDPFLASRLPNIISEIARPHVVGQLYQFGDYVTSGGSTWVCYQAAGTANAPPTDWTMVLPADVTRKVWRSSGGPLLTGTFFESPLLTAPPFVTPQRHGLIPDSVPLAGTDYPAFITVNTDGSGYTRFLAADADGDGIADSLLSRLPVAATNGITWFYATRVIDNNSAVNTNTALSKANDYLATDATRSGALGEAVGAAVEAFNLGAFKSHVGLMQMTADYQDVNPYESAELSALLINRFGTASTGVADNMSAVIDDSNAARVDSVFAVKGDTLDAQVAFRLGNPGYRSVGNYFTPLFVTESFSLAYRFVIRNANASPSILETALNRSLVSNSVDTVVANQFVVRTTAYAPAQVDQWYTDNFDFTSAEKPLRSLLTLRNPVSQGTPAMLRDTGVWSDLVQYRFGDWVLGSDGRAYVALRPSLGAFDPTDPLTFNVQWAPVPWVTSPQKANINTADFANLYTAFFSAIASRTGTADWVAPTALGASQFDNPLRDPALVPTAVLTFDETVQLRAALAAVNASDLRDGDDDVTSRDIYISDSTTPINLKWKATVFGTERQPYITEVYANNDTTTPGPTSGLPNPKGYVAVELHNPYPFPIDIRNWQLAVINRTEVALPPPGFPYDETIDVQPLSGFLGFRYFTAADGTLPTPAIIPANGYVILENRYWVNALVGPPLPYLASPLTDATDRPASVQTALGALIPAPLVCYVPNLHEVMGDAAAVPAKLNGELVLLRPHKANNTYPVNPVTGLNDEGTIDGVTLVVTPILTALIPVDSFDFTGMLPNNGTDAVSIHYVRENGPGHAWKFVYPGHYARNVGTGAIEPNVMVVDRQEGTQRTATWLLAGGTEPPPTTPINMGVADTASTYPNLFPPIQLNNTDWAGANKVGPAWVITEQYLYGQIATYNNVRYGCSNVAGSIGVAPPGADWTALGALVHPSGGFAREGDILQTPFVGAYVLRQVDATGLAIDTPTQVREMNAVTMDLANLGDAGVVVANVDNADEELGRFCPMKAVNPTLTAADRAAWASDIFDYLTTRSPLDDHSPNIDPVAYPLDPAASPVLPNAVSNNTVGAPATYTYGRALAGTGVGTVVGTTNLVPTDAFYASYRITFVTGAAAGESRVITTYTGASRAADVGTAFTATPVAGDLFRIEGVCEESAGVEGLININTAPWPVLQALPGVDANLAKAIVDYRNSYGPFTSIFDLNRVIDTVPDASRTFQVGGGAVAGTLDTGNIKLYLAGGVTTPDTTAVNDPRNAQGDFSPIDPTATTPDGVRGDFEERLLMLTRISNLITTRSDTFTAYVLVQGWSGVGTATPQLIVQRRAIALIDRTVATPKDKNVKAINVPVD